MNKKGAQRVNPSKIVMLYYSFFTLSFFLQQIFNMMYDIIKLQR